VPHEELVQIARVAGFRAVVDAYVPGRSVQSFVWVVMTRAVRRESWSQSFIVSGFRHRGGAAMGTAIGWGGVAPEDVRAAGAAFVCRDPLPDAHVIAEEIENTFRALAGAAGFSVDAIDVVLDYRDTPNNRLPLWSEVARLREWASTDKQLRAELLCE
jgi:hypothetical protein